MSSKSNLKTADLHVKRAVTAKSPKKRTNSPARKIKLIDEETLELQQLAEQQQLENKILKQQLDQQQDLFATTRSDLQKFQDTTKISLLEKETELAQLQTTVLSAKEAIRARDEKISNLQQKETVLERLKAAYTDLKKQHIILQDHNQQMIQKMDQTKMVEIELQKVIQENEKFQKVLHTTKQNNEALEGAKQEASNEIMQLRQEILELQVLKQRGDQALQQQSLNCELEKQKLSFEKQSLSKEVQDLTDQNRNFAEQIKSGQHQILKLEESLRQQKEKVADYTNKIQQLERLRIENEEKIPQQHSIQKQLAFVSQQLQESHYNSQKLTESNQLLVQQLEEAAEKYESVKQKFGQVLDIGKRQKQQIQKMESGFEKQKEQLQEQLQQFKKEFTQQSEAKIANIVKTKDAELNKLNQLQQISISDTVEIKKLYNQEQQRYKEVEIALAGLKQEIKQKSEELATKTDKYNALELLNHRKDKIIQEFQVKSEMLHNQVSESQKIQEGGQLSVILQMYDEMKHRLSDVTSKQDESFLSQSQILAQSYKENNELRQKAENEYAKQIVVERELRKLISEQNEKLVFMSKNETLTNNRLHEMTIQQNADQNRIKNLEKELEKCSQALLNCQNEKIFLETKSFQLLQQIEQQQPQLSDQQAKQQPISDDYNAILKSYRTQLIELRKQNEQLEIDNNACDEMNQQLQIQADQQKNENNTLRLNTQNLEEAIIDIKQQLIAAMSKNDSLTSQLNGHKDCIPRQMYQVDVEAETSRAKLIKQQYDIIIQQNQLLQTQMTELKQTVVREEEANVNNTSIINRLSRSKSAPAVDLRVKSQVAKSPKRKPAEESNVLMQSLSRKSRQQSDEESDETKKVLTRDKFSSVQRLQPSDELNLVAFNTDKYDNDIKKLAPIRRMSSTLTKASLFEPKLGQLQLQVPGITKDELVQINSTPTRYMQKNLQDSDISVSQVTKDDNYKNKNQPIQIFSPRSPQRLLGNKEFAVSASSLIQRKNPKTYTVPESGVKIRKQVLADEVNLSVTEGMERHIQNQADAIPLSSSTKFKNMKNVQKQEKIFSSHAARKKSAQHTDLDVSTSICQTTRLQEPDEPTVSQFNAGNTSRRAQAIDFEPSVSQVIRAKSDPRDNNEPSMSQVTRNHKKQTVVNHVANSSKIVKKVVKKQVDDIMETSASFDISKKPSKLGQIQFSESTVDKPHKKAKKTEVKEIISNASSDDESYYESSFESQILGDVDEPIKKASVKKQPKKRVEKEKGPNSTISSEYSQDENSSSSQTSNAVKFKIQSAKSGHKQTTQNSISVKHLNQIEDTGEPHKKLRSQAQENKTQQRESNKHQQDKHDEDNGYDLAREEGNDAKIDLPKQQKHHNQQHRQKEQNIITEHGAQKHISNTQNHNHNNVADDTIHVTKNEKHKKHQDHLHERSSQKPSDYEQNEDNNQQQLEDVNQLKYQIIKLDNELQAKEIEVKIVKEQIFQKLESQKDLYEQQIQGIQKEHQDFIKNNELNQVKLELQCETVINQLKASEDEKISLRQQFAAITKSYEQIQRKAKQLKSQNETLTQEIQTQIKQFDQFISEKNDEKEQYQKEVIIYTTQIHNLNFDNAAKQLDLKSKDEQLRLLQLTKDTLQNNYIIAQGDIKKLNQIIQDKNVKITDLDNSILILKQNLKEKQSELQQYQDQYQQQIVSLNDMHNKNLDDTNNLKNTVTKLQNQLIHQQAEASAQVQDLIQKQENTTIIKENLEKSVQSLQKQKIEQDALHHSTIEQIRKETQQIISEKQQQFEYQSAYEKQNEINAIRQEQQLSISQLNIAQTQNLQSFEQQLKNCEYQLMNKEQMIIDLQENMFTLQRELKATKMDYQSLQEVHQQQQQKIAELQDEIGTIVNENNIVMQENLSKSQIQQTSLVSQEQEIEKMKSVMQRIKQNLDMQKKLNDDLERDNMDCKQKLLNATQQLIEPQQKLHQLALENSVFKKENVSLVSEISHLQQQMQELTNDLELERLQSTECAAKCSMLEAEIQHLQYEKSELLRQIEIQATKQSEVELLNFQLQQQCNEVMTERSVLYKQNQAVVQQQLSQPQLAMIKPIGNKQANAQFLKLFERLTLEGLSTAELQIIIQNKFVPQPKSKQFVLQYIQKLQNVGGSIARSGIVSNTVSKGTATLQQLLTYSDAVKLCLLKNAPKLQNIDTAAFFTNVQKMADLIVENISIVRALHQQVSGECYPADEVNVQLVLSELEADSLRSPVVQDYLFVKVLARALWSDVMVQYQRAEPHVVLLLKSAVEAARLMDIGVALPIIAVQRSGNLKNVALYAGEDVGSEVDLAVQHLILTVLLNLKGVRVEVASAATVYPALVDASGGVLSAAKVRGE